MQKATKRILPAKDKSIAGAPFVGKTREVEYRIEGNPGLVLAVLAPRADGSVGRVWRAYYSVMANGKRTIRKVRIGAYPKIGLAAARRRAAEIAEEVERGRDVVADARAARVLEERAARTFADLVGDYLAAQRDAEVKTVDEIERALKKDAIPALGPLSPATITDVEVERVIDAVARRGSKSAARHLLTYVRGVFNHALLYSPELRERYGVRHNPAGTVGRAPRGREGKYGRSRPKNRALDDAEIVAFWRAIDASKADAATVAVIKLLLLTGQRLGEVRGAQIEELRLAGGELLWSLPADRTKNGEPHAVPLSPAAAALFREAVGRRRVGSVFASELSVDGKLGDFTIRKALRRLLALKRNGTRALDLPHFTAHDLRRTVATGLGRIGVPDDTISRVLNHKKGDVTSEHYQRHQYEREKRAALGRWAEHVARLVG